MAARWWHLAQRTWPLLLTKGPLWDTVPPRAAASSQNIKYGREVPDESELPYSCISAVAAVLRRYLLPSPNSPISTSAPAPSTRCRLGWDMPQFVRDAGYRSAATIADALPSASVAPCDRQGARGRAYADLSRRPLYRKIDSLQRLAAAPASPTGPNGSAAKF